jgi:hypothetical protein
LSRYRFIDIMPVSELEKKAERKIRMARSMNNVLVEKTFN